MSTLKTQSGGSLEPVGSVRLTGDAAFAAAVMAGVPIESSWDHRGSVRLTTAYPVDVWMDGEIITVFSAPNEEVSDRSQPPPTFHLSLSEPAGSCSLDRLVGHPFPQNAQSTSAGHSLNPRRLRS